MARRPAGGRGAAPLMSLQYLGPLGLSHIAAFTFFLPWVAWRSAQRQRDRPWPERMAVFRSVLIQQAVFLTFSWYVARREWVPLYFRPDRWWVSAGAVVLVTAVLVTTMRPVWRRAVERNEPRMQLSRLETPADYAMWLAVSVAAGVVEEVSYRGVLWVLLERLTGSSLVAALIAAIAFGVAHSMQGWRSVGIITVIALGMHGLVRATGSLLAPIGVHIAYDVVAGLSYARLHRRIHPREASHVGVD